MYYNIVGDYEIDLFNLVLISFVKLDRFVSLEVFVRWGFEGVFLMLKMDK